MAYQLYLASQPTETAFYRNLDNAKRDAADRADSDIGWQFSKHNILRGTDGDGDVWVISPVLFSD